MGTSEGILLGEEAEPPPGIWRPPFGIVLFQCMIVTRAYPWKVGTPGRRGDLDYRRMKSWGADVTMTLRVHGRCDLPQPVVIDVDLDVLFVVERMPSRQNPDATNLRKQFEDLLQGIVYLNDTQVQGGETRRAYIGDPIVGREGETWDGPERIHFRVTSLG